MVIWVPLILVKVSSVLIQLILLSQSLLLLLILIKINVVELTRDQIASGQVFFSSNPSPDNVGKTVDLEFNVKDSSGDISVIPGLIRISILDAPSTVEESIVDAKYKSIFEAELGTGRFDFTDRLIEQAGLTRDEGLTVIRSAAEESFNRGLLMALVLFLRLALLYPELLSNFVGMSVHLIFTLIQIPRF